MSRVLLDTHILLWSQNERERLPAAVDALMALPETELYFSVASIWEIAIKQSQGRRDFNIHPGALRNALVGAGYVELPVRGEHTVALMSLPLIHRDPFDRMLLAQAIVEGIELVTVDADLALYPGPIRVF
jgi:PIN domain nuclease of toxin-antitoxin system